MRIPGFRGPPHPLKGDEPSRRVREAAKVPCAFRTVSARHRPAASAAGRQYAVALISRPFARVLALFGCMARLVVAAVCLVTVQGAIEAVFESSAPTGASLATSRIHGIEGGSSVVPTSGIPPPIASASSRYPSASPSYMGAGSPTLGDPLHQPPISTGTMQGFGYDPLFEVVEYHQTFAELGLNVKRAISHRSRALREFLRQLDAKL